MNTRGFPGTFAPRYQELAFGKQRGLGPPGTLRDPAVHRVGGRLDRGVTVRRRDRRWRRRSSSHAPRHAAPCWPALRGRRDQKPERGWGNPSTPSPGRCGGPRPSRRAASSPPRPTMSILASAPVIASNPVAKHDRVEIVVRVGRVDTRGVDGLDRRLADADQLHVGLVEGLKVVGVGADPLGADRVVDRE